MRANGIDVHVHEFLSPRLEKHGERHSIRAAAKSLCEGIPEGSGLVFYPDEVITGTRFRKLYAALSKLLGDRLVPIALEVRSVGAAVLSGDQLSRLHAILNTGKYATDGVPTHKIFPPAALIKIDDGPPIVASSPFFWAEVDLCAGKRKVNFVLDS